MTVNKQNTQAQRKTNIMAIVVMFFPLCNDFVCHKPGRSPRHNMEKPLRMGRYDGQYDELSRIPLHGYTGW